MHAANLCLPTRPLFLHQHCLALSSPWEEVKVRSLASSPAAFYDTLLLHISVVHFCCTLLCLFCVIYFLAHNGCDQDRTRQVVWKFWRIKEIQYQGRHSGMTSMLAAYLFASLHH